MMELTKMSSGELCILMNEIDSEIKSREKKLPKKTLKALIKRIDDIYSSEVVELKVPISVKVFAGNRDFDFDIIGDLYGTVDSALKNHTKVKGAQKRIAKAIAAMKKDVKKLAEEKGLDEKDILDQIGVYD